MVGQQNFEINLLQIHLENLYSFTTHALKQKESAFFLFSFYSNNFFIQNMFQRSKRLSK